MLGGTATLGLELNKRFEVIPSPAGPVGRRLKLPSFPDRPGSHGRTIDLGIGLRTSVCDHMLGGTATLGLELNERFEVIPSPAAFSTG